MKTISYNEMLNRFIGEPGTTERVEFENELEAEVLAQKLKELRLKKKSYPIAIG